MLILIFPKRDTLDGILYPFRDLANTPPRETCWLYIVNKACSLQGTHRYWLISRTVLGQTRSQLAENREQFKGMLTQESF